MLLFLLFTSSSILTTSTNLRPSSVKAPRWCTTTTNSSRCTRGTTTWSPNSRGTTTLKCSSRETTTTWIRAARRWKGTMMLERGGTTAITRIIAGLTTSTTMVTTTSTSSTIEEATSSTTDATTAAEDTIINGTTTGTMTRIGSNQGVMIRTGLTNGSKRIVTLSRQLGGI